MQMEISRDQLDSLIAEYGEAIDRYEMQGLQVSGMHQLYGQLDEYRQERTLEEIQQERQEQREEIRRLSMHYLGREPEQSLGMER